MAYTLVVAEKPSVARDIARVLGARQKGDGYYEGGGYRVTWAIGHLVTLKDPEEIDPKWKRWREADLPILPEALPLKILPKTKKQFGIIKGLMGQKDVTGLICATDAGREGELIFRYIYRMAGCTKPFSRLWISSMTDEAIKEGFSRLAPGQDYDALYESARCRSEADWLVGMNASRAFTLRYDALLPIGRVQTPTLALLARRQREMQDFVATPYFTVTASFGGYTGLWRNEETGEKRLYDEAAAKAIARKVEGQNALVEQVLREEKKEWPPYLYDLTSLQRDANRILGFTAKKTLEKAQALYETYKLLTYPRTDSRHLPRDMAGRAFTAVKALESLYPEAAKPLLEKGKLPLIRRVFDDAKVKDHHAILPTGKALDRDKLPAEERALYDLVARRLLAAFYPEHRYEAIKVLTRCEGEAFESLGRVVGQMGWKAVYQDMKKAIALRLEEGEEVPLPALMEGEVRHTEKATVKADKTKPPPPYTDASLLSAMERAGKEIADEELRQSMKDSGLGTPATRAAIIERLISVGYAQRKGRTIAATEKGMRLILAVPGDIASPETTGRWEKALSGIAAGEMEPERFLSGIRRLSASLVESAKVAPTDIQFEKEERRGRGKAGGKGRAAPKYPPLAVPCPLCGKGKVMENSKAFYCERYREGCKLTLWKNSAERLGGPALTAALMERLLKEGAVHGSTGTLCYREGRIGFDAVSKST